MSKSKGMHWPYGIALSFVLVFALIVMTIIVASDNKVEDADLYMQNYHDADANANEIIIAEIAFKKKYSISFATPKLDPKGTVIAYKLTDKLGNPVTDASLEVVVTRPNTHAHDMTLTNPTVSVDGIYAFDAVALPLEGRWDIMAKITVGDDYRYYNLKADTRYSNVFEY
jgi:nitrogen fixation protein FixH